jgi:hypothetical protein
MESNLDEVGKSSCCSNIDTIYVGVLTVLSMLAGTIEDLCGEAMVLLTFRMPTILVIVGIVLERLRL